MPTKEELFAIAPLEEDFSIPKIGTVVIREMDATQRDQWEQLVNRERKKSDVGEYKYFRASLVVFGIRHKLPDGKTGDLLFSVKDIERISSMPGKLIDDMWDVAARLSGITEEAEKEIGKNLTTGQSDGST